MEAEMTEVEFYTRFVQDELESGEITQVQSGPHRIRAGQRNRGHGRNWVAPWLKMSTASTCPRHCDGFELDMV